MVSHAGLRHGRSEVHTESWIISNYFDYFMHVRHAVKLRRLYTQTFHRQNVQTGFLVITFTSMNFRYV